MIERWRGRIAEGMQVRSADGEKLGKVVACHPTGFMVEKGFLFPKDLTIPYERVTDIRNGEIMISLARADLGEPAGHAASGSVSAAKEAAASAASEARAALGGAPRVFEQFGKRGEIHVPLAEEEVVASKHVEKVGEVHVRKEVITEEKQITVPVTREVVRIERVAVSQEMRPGEKVFEKESYDIPISEEHVTIEKRPVVREELLVGKEIQQSEETASTTVRRERADVETMGTVRRLDVPSADKGQLRPTGTGGRR